MLWYIRILKPMNILLSWMREKLLWSRVLAMLWYTYIFTKTEVWKFYIRYLSFYASEILYQNLNSCYVPWKLKSAEKQTEEIVLVVDRWLVVCLTVVPHKQLLEMLDLCSRYIHINCIIHGKYPSFGGWVWEHSPWEGPSFFEMSCMFTKIQTYTLEKSCFPSLFYIQCI